MVIAVTRWTMVSGDSGDSVTVVTVVTVVQWYSGERMDSGAVVTMVAGATVVTAVAVVPCDIGDNGGSLSGDKLYTTSFLLCVFFLSFRKAQSGADASQSQLKNILANFREANVK
jgi:hypothetical protein